MKIMKNALVQPSAGQGGVEHASERTSTCVSERAQEPTQA
jgi:hypothetical protein